MIAITRYKELEKLCDQYFEIGAELDGLINNFNESTIEDYRNGLLPKISEKIKKQDEAAETYVKEIWKEADELVDGIDLERILFINRAYKKVISNMDMEGDNSRYNRIHRLQDLDKLVDAYKHQNP